jgi:hypothetical protein
LGQACGGARKIGGPNARQSLLDTLAQRGRQLHLKTSWARP